MLCDWSRDGRVGMAPGWRVTLRTSRHRTRSIWSYRKRGFLGQAMIPRALIWCVVVMLIGALLPMPYDYYTLLRVASSATFAIGARAQYRVGAPGHATVFAVFAIMLNPFVPIHLARATWAFVDLAAACLLLGWDRRTRRSVPPS